ncbi:MAG: hypothetical protein K2O22_03080 [Anaeroplasmataceae bacterium]|nr:hypothetical protein [Anaeroplasmataceae bacterium]
MKKILCFMVLLCSLFFIVGCKSEYVKVEKPEEKPIEEIKQASPLMRELNLLGMASLKEFKVTAQPHKSNYFISNRNQVKELSDEEPTVVEDLTYTYPFDYVKIHSAIKFSISIPENKEDEALEMIQDSCGLGDLDVILADFSTFVFDEKKESLCLAVQDRMVTFVGKKGLYTILANSGKYQYDQGNTY